VLLFFLSQSLLEHQSNPKKPLKMHFKNSMVKPPINEYLGYPH
jgi:kinesin family protein 18/19